MNMLNTVVLLWTIASNLLFNSVKHDYQETEKAYDWFGCVVKERGGDIHVDCSCRNFIFIPTLPVNATSVDLSNNQIRTIMFLNPFAKMMALRELDLSDNPLEFIINNIFYGLTNLTKLSMRNTLLYKQKNLVLDTLLAGLYNLRVFHFTFLLPEIREFSPIPCYFKFKKQPFASVSSLATVDILEIDSALLKWRFNSSFTKDIFRTKWLYVVNGFVCYYGTFTKHQFDFMPYLEFLNITNPFLTGAVTNDFLSKQIRLRELSIVGPNSPYGYAIDLIYNVTMAVSSQPRLTSLTLNGISDNIRMRFHCSLGIYNLSGLTSLNTVNLIGNSLSFNSIEECDNFPNSLENLDLHGNCLSLFDINYSLLFFNRQIKSINARDQSKCNFMYRTERVKRRFNKDNTERRYSFEFLVLTNSTERIDFAQPEDLFLNLTHLDLSMNDRAAKTFIPNFFSSSRPSLEYLNMSKCRISSIEKRSFENFSKLKRLDLSWNMLGSMECNLSERLEGLVSLEELNLSNNYITCLKPESFNLMKNIRTIDVHKNKIQHLKVTFGQTKHLKQLNLSSNRIQKLSKRTTEELDMIASKVHLTIDLSDNMLLCTCENLYFLQWLRTTNVHLKNKKNYVCSFSNGSLTTLRFISQVVQDITSQCSPKTALFVMVSASTACIIVTVSAVIIYRFRWKLRYFYYNAKIKLPYRRLGNDYEQIFEYDAFISYSAEDHKIAREGTLTELESNRGIHACIHEHDFLPGESIAVNISRGIRSSKRTILFLSSNFVASEWCMYELNIARMETLHTGRKVILIVIIEEIIKNTLPVDILDFINTYTYLEYPRNGSEADVDVFWSKCADFVFNN